MYILALIFMPVVCYLMIFKPEILWKIRHYFTVENGEPTDFYIWSTRIYGILLAVGGIVALILILLGY